ncbi:MAG: CHAT domain-containing protein [Planctomycetota bacterium]
MAVALPENVGRPTLTVYTTSFHESDKEPTRTLGLQLYDHLTRPISEPLSPGAGIPVWSDTSPDSVDVESARTVLVIAVLGKEAFLTKRDEALDRLRGWHEQLGEGHVLPLVLSQNWLAVENQLPGGLALRTALYGEQPQQETLIEIVNALSRRLAPDGQSPVLFLSHAKADLKPTKQAAKKIADYAKTNATTKAFFDRTELLVGESLQRQLDFATSRGVFVAVRGDSYSSRIWCQHELLQAKKSGLPTLGVEVLSKGESRSLAYGGNGPTLVWAQMASETADEEPIETPETDSEDGVDDDDRRSSVVVLRAMVEWVRAEHFRQEARRIARQADLPETTVLVRPPELLDLAQGPLNVGQSFLVMHPDPELPTQERQILRAANPRLRLVTPLTSYRRVLSHDSRLAGEVPLGGMRVALSLSDSPDLNGPKGYHKHHLADATVQVARSVISAGGEIAYGGDFRHESMNDPDRLGFTILLAELLGGYNQMSGTAKFLHSYLGAPIPMGDVPDSLPLQIYHMVETPAMAELAVMPVDEVSEHPSALYFSDMRQAMVKSTDARVIIGGGIQPRLEAGGPGYGGRYPGVVEEAWRSMQRQQALYVVGGYGGAAATIAKLLQERSITPELHDETWMEHEYFRENAERIDQNSYHDQLGLPTSMQDLGEAIVREAERLLDSDAASIAWNGLTLAENHELSRTRDNARITSLVSRGLLNVRRQQAAGKLQIELVHGSLADASELDAIAVAAFDKVPLGGAGAVIDQISDGELSKAHQRQERFVGLNRPQLDADWLYLASLGRLSDDTPIEQRIQDAASKTAEMVHKHGLRRLGVVSFGGTIVESVEQVAEPMVNGLLHLGSDASVSWFESDRQRFEDLQRWLGQHEDVQLTFRESALPLPRLQPKAQPLIVQTSYDGDELIANVLPPTGNAIVQVLRRSMTLLEMEQLAAGGGMGNESTPAMPDLRDLGQRLGQLLLGEDAEQILQATSSAPWVIIHDVESSRLPFETIRGDAVGPPAVSTGLTRRLAVSGVPIESLLARPTDPRRVRVLLIVNPTEDLMGAEAEGDSVEAIFGQLASVDLRVLRRSEATKEACLEAMRQADVLHYCGHAFYDGPGDGDSGLVLANHQTLTLQDLASVVTPRMVFFNACEAGRVRGQGTTSAPTVSFAEMFLRGGVEAYVGTFWMVGDAAAKVFAEELYGALATGETLDGSIVRGRKRLYEENHPDWANYLLYGDGRFRLVRSK